MSKPQAKRPSPAACTIITRCYLSHARILIESYQRHEPGGQFYLVVVDGLPDGVTAGANVRMIAIEDLELPHLHELLFKYDLVEFCTAIKPTLLALLMNRFDERQVLYIDPDIMIARPLDELVAALSNSSIVLTPHLLRPHAMDGQHPSDQDILMAGTYNLGFIGLCKTKQTMDFLRWWEERLKEGCRIDPSHGLMTDQKWIDLVPGLFSQTTILRDDTYNVAYWNTNARRIIRCGDQFLVNARPLAFFHFSNFDPDNPLGFSRDHGRGKIIKGTGLGDLLELYAKLQIQAGYITSIEWKYQRATFDNGVAISPPVRKLYLNLSPAARLQFGDPFLTGDANSFFNWAITKTSHLTPFLQSVYDSRPDLQGAFLDIAGADNARFLQWAQETGPQEMGYDRRLAGVEVSEIVHQQPIEYSELVTQLRQIAGRCLPVDGIVGVISKGDNALLELGGRSAAHFPQSETGQYAGHYPRDGADALAQLRSQLQRGMRYLIIPATSSWWLDHYGELNQYLQDKCQQIADEPGICQIFALGEMSATAAETPEQRIERILQDRAVQVEQLIAENIQLRSKLRELDMLQRGSQIDEVKVFWRSEIRQPPTPKSALQKPRLIFTGDIRWLSHEATGRVISIILPVNISPGELGELLKKLAAQKSADSIEVIAFTIGSSDARQPQLQDFGATILWLAQNDPAVINQNAARNLAAKYARGKILVFLGEQTLPADEYWLANLVYPLDTTPNLAGVCSHLTLPPSRSLRYSEEPDNAEIQTDFHTQSTAIRAEIFGSIPFMELGLADGRAWARAAQLAGFAVLCEPKSIALHTPPALGAIDDLRRGITEGLLDQQPPEARLDPKNEPAFTMGRWLGRYLHHASPRENYRNGGN